MGQTAEIDAQRYKVKREDQDQMAFLSQQRTAAAQKAGRPYPNLVDNMRAAKKK